MMTSGQLVWGEVRRMVRQLDVAGGIVVRVRIDARDFDAVVRRFRLSDARDRLALECETKSRRGEQIEVWRAPSLPAEGGATISPDDT
jgi:hypothetical protein